MGLHAVDEDLLAAREKAADLIGDDVKHLDACRHAMNGRDCEPTGSFGISFRGRSLPSYSVTLMQCHPGGTNFPSDSAA